jgi:type IV secretory pathway VirB2 component (pilin)
MPLIQAAELEGMTDSDKAAFDQILEPVMKIYNFVKYSATLVAVIVLLFSGINYMISGYDIKKREQAKSMAMYVIIGLIVIWAAPFVVNLIAG